MKKILSVILSSVMLLSIAAIGVSAEESTDLVVSVANDLHYNMKGSAELTFWEKLVKFFKDMFAYIARIFGF